MEEQSGFVVKLNVHVTKVLSGKTVGVYVAEVAGTGPTEKEAKAAAVKELELTPNRLGPFYTTTT